jgi:hypothetical protein
MTPADISILFWSSAVAILILGATIAYRIATACRHNWIVKQIITLVSGFKSEIPVGRKIVMQCSKCGSIQAKAV